MAPNHPAFSIVVYNDAPVGDLDDSLELLILTTPMQFIEKLRQGGGAGAGHFNVWQIERSKKINLEILCEEKNMYDNHPIHNPIDRIIIKNMSIGRN